MGTRPNQDSDTVSAILLREGFNSSSRGQALDSSHVQDATKEQEKAQLAQASIEKTEIQALVRDMDCGGEVSADEAQGSKTRRLDIKDKIEKQRWRRFVAYLQMRQAIEAALEKVQALIEFHQSQMDILAELLQEGRDRLAELLEQKLALLQEVDRFRGTGRFDLDENGKFKDEKAKQALAEWEEKTGVRLDLNAPSSYLGVMEVVESIEAEEAETQAGIERDELDYQYHKTKRDEAIEIKNDLESDDPERCRIALERLENLGGNQRLGITENSLTSKTEMSLSQRQDILGHVKLTNEDLFQNGFSFNFPPLQADFNSSVIDDKKNERSDVPEKPETKTTLPNPYIR